MESVQIIKRRIRGVRNIGQITKAMELVAATKMRRSQELALNSRPYALSALELLANLSQLEGVKLPALLEKREFKKRAFLLVTSDKGLAGSLNSSVLRAFEKFAGEGKLDLTDSTYTFIAVGEIAAQYLERKNLAVARTFTHAGDYTATEEIAPIAEFLIAGYLAGTWDEVTVFSTNFRSALRQEVLKRPLFPVDFENLKTSVWELIPETGRFSELFGEEIKFFEKPALEYLIEPEANFLLEALTRHLIHMQVYHLILEANASEHAARRMAMKSASDNAEDLEKKLNLLYNKSRQAGITKEIIEITSGAASATSL